MDFIFTPWRYQYMAKAAADEGKKDTCVFCRALKRKNDDESLIVHRGRKCFVILNRYPYASGHVMIAPFKHLDQLQKLDKRSAAEMIELAQKLEAILGRVYRPDGLNIGMNIGRAAGAGVAGHVHMHVVPRWVGDSNFMTIAGETRVLPEALEQTLEKLKRES
jgi:ATP adenylyltransferase